MGIYPGWEKIISPFLLGTPYSIILVPNSKFGYNSIRYIFSVTGSTNVHEGVVDDNDPSVKGYETSTPHPGSL